MKNIHNKKKSQYYVMFFTLKILALFFCSSPLFQYFFNETSGTTLENLNMNIILAALFIFVVITFMWIVMDRSRKEVRIFIIAEIAMFFAVCIFSIMFSGMHESYYKFLFMFIVISYTIEMGMKTGIIVASIASTFILGLDLVKGAGEGVNTFFQTDIALCAMFVVIAWILGSYVKIANEHIEQLTNAVNLDSLTNIYNHRYFQDTLRQKCDDNIKNGKPLSLIFLDIDYFKTYNDIFGHQKGDMVLKQLAELLKNNIRKQDTLYRYGGEEFAILMDNTGKDEAIKIGEQIRKLVDEYDFEGQDLLPAGSVTVSAGVSELDGEGDTPVELINRADSALYRAKFFRRNRVEQYVSVFDRDSKLDSKLTSLKSLINVIHSRDFYTYNHIERVVWYCQLYAEHMKLNEEDRTKLIYSAYLHDLGKINVSKHILISSGKLTDQEWEEMKKHPSDSAEMIRRVEGLEDLVDIVLHHHERFDGKGYPDRISGEEINPLARVLTVADSFDAMTSNRPYQSARNYQAAFEEIRQCTGTQFDPIIAENFITALQKSLC